MLKKRFYQGFSYIDLNIFRLCFKLSIKSNLSQKKIFNITFFLYTNFERSIFCNFGINVNLLQTSMLFVLSKEF